MFTLITTSYILTFENFNKSIKQVASHLHVKCFNGNIADFVYICVICHLKMFDYFLKLSKLSLERFYLVFLVVHQPENTIAALVL